MRVHVSVKLFLAPEPTTDACLYGGFGSAGIPSDDYFCYVAECVWNIQEVEDGNPVETFQREMPRTTPATKDALYAETKRLDAQMKEKFRIKPQGTVNKAYVSDGLTLTPRTRVALSKGGKLAGYLSEGKANLGVC